MSPSIRSRMVHTPGCYKPLDMTLFMLELLGELSIHAVPSLGIRLHQLHRKYPTATLISPNRSLSVLITAAIHPQLSPRSGGRSISPGGGGGGDQGATMKPEPHKYVGLCAEWHRSRVGYFKWLLLSDNKRFVLAQALSATKST